MSRGRRTEPGGPMLLDGAHLVSEALALGDPAAPASRSRRARWHPTRALAWPRPSRGRGLSVVEVTDSVMEAMSPVASPSGVIAIADRPASSLEGALDASSPAGGRGRRRAGARQRRSHRPRSGGVLGDRRRVLRRQRRRVRLEGPSGFDGQRAPAPRGLGRAGSRCLRGHASAGPSPGRHGPLGRRAAGRRSTSASRRLSCSAPRGPA